MNHKSRWRVRPVRRVDWVRLRRMLKSADLPVQGVEAGAKGQFLVASSVDGLIGGLVGLEIHDSYGLLRSLVVAEWAMGCGLGETLVRAIEVQAKARQAKGLFLLTTTAAGYFERIGYVRTERSVLPEPIRRSEEFTRLCPDSAVAMKKPLIAAGTTPDHS